MHDDAAAGSRGIEAWLLSGQALRGSGAGDAAGVVNWHLEDGSWDGLYPEICGYYLQFAARAAPAAGRGDDMPHRIAACRVARWLDAVGGGAFEPLTLYHRDMAQSDWRNRCLFAFDLSIILRGLCTAESRWPGSMPGGLIERAAVSLSRLVSDGRLASHRVRDGVPEAEIPPKWSTLPGVHHVKAAAAIAGSASAGIAAPAAGILRDAAAATLRHEARHFSQAGQARMRELHPFLYFIEGWLTLWGQDGNRQALGHAASAFAMLLGQIDPHSGETPPVADQRGAVTRSDVLAQALRAGLVLEAAGALDAEADAMWRPRRRALQAALQRHVSPQGAILFDRAGQHRNSWASMFGWQALRFLAEAQASAIDPIASAAALI